MQIPCTMQPHKHIDNGHTCKLRLGKSRLWFHKQKWHCMCVFAYRGRTWSQGTHSGRISMPGVTRRTWVAMCIHLWPSSNGYFLLDDAFVFRHKVTRWFCCINIIHLRLEIQTKKPPHLNPTEHTFDVECVADVTNSCEAEPQRNVYNLLQNLHHKELMWFWEQREELPSISSTLLVNFISWWPRNKGLYWIVVQP